MFLGEGVVFGGIGSVIGVVIGAIGAYPLVTKGITLSTEISEKFPLPMKATFKGAYSTELFVVGLATGILATVVGVMWPAFKASRLDPVAALRK